VPVRKLICKTFGVREDQSFELSNISKARDTPRAGATGSRAISSMLVPMVLMRTRLIVLFFFLGAGSVTTAQPPSQPRPSNVHSARIENFVTVPDKAGIHVNIKNTGERPVTAFLIEFYMLNPNGQHIPCGGSGADMIDWSDAMPGRSFYVHMRRNWIPTNGTLLSDGYPRCPGAPAQTGSMQAELSYIMFDDGTGEGDARQIEFTLRTRQQARNERLRWVGRFTVLRDTSDLKSSAQSLYQDLVDAVHAAEIVPDVASRQEMARPVRDEMQHLALDITQWAAHNESLHKNEYLEWRVTDLEQRTARLIRGAGTTWLAPR